jgi:hypothetical protein
MISVFRIVKEIESRAMRRTRPHIVVDVSVVILQSQAFWRSGGDTEKAL